MSREEENRRYAAQQREEELKRERDRRDQYQRAAADAKSKADNSQTDRTAGGKYVHRHVPGWG